jgi:hypothetical protein
MAPFLTKAPLPVRSFRDIKKEFASAPVERGVD